MYLYAFLFAQFPELFSCVGHVWNYNGDVLFVVGWSIVVVGDGGGGVRLLGWVNLCCHWLRAHSGN